MSGFAVLSYRLLGPLFESRRARLREEQLRLYRAHVPLRATAFQAAAACGSLLAATGVAALAFLVLRALAAPWWVAAPVSLVLGATSAMAAYHGARAWLDLRGQQLARDIEENLPHGLNYLLALANAGLPPKEMWASLARQPVFGALSLEAARIHRDLDLFGHDILRALRSAQERTPSRRFTEFLQGAISAFRSGVELPAYLRTKAAQYQHEEEQAQREAIETIGLLAEAFLVVVVAAPLFMIILLTVMGITQGDRVVLYGKLLVLGFIPVAQLTIGGLIRSMNPRIWT